MKIAIIGAGFYGTYIAYKFSKNNKHQVDIFEKNKQICSEVVKNNQYRLHTGFHYPRSLETIAQTLKQLNDVNVTSLSDGALLQYDAATDKFTARNELNTTTGPMIFNGGAF